MIKKIGFIGTGVMGSSMIRNLMKAGYELSIYSRTKAKAEPLITEGACWHETAEECVRDCDAVITIVGFPKDVEEVYFGTPEKRGIIEASKEGAYLIDMTTSSPKLAVRISEEAAKAGKQALDAPVSGGDTGAKKGTLSIMVGGEKAAFDAVLPVFQAMGTNVTYEGAAGCGQHTKMANQIALTAVIAGVCEAITYAEKTGLNVQTMLDSISKGAAGSWQMDNNAPKIVKEDYAPGFYIKHFIKDMRIAEAEGADAGVNMPVLDTVLKMYENLDEKGFGDLGTQALIKYYQDR